MALGALFAATTSNSASALPPSSAGPEERLGQAREGLDAARERRTATLARLQAVSARRAALDRDLAALEERLSEAQTAVAQNQRDVTRATGVLLALDERVQGLQQQSQRDRRRLSETARDAYAYGPMRYADALLGASDVSDLSHALVYAGILMEGQQQQVNDSVEQELETMTAVARFESLQDRMAERREEITVERDRVAALLSERRALREQLNEQAQQQEAMLEAIEADREHYTALVATLEEESARLAAALRNRSAPPIDGTTIDGIVWPADGPIKSPFGWRTHPISGVGRLHTGVDIGAVAGAPVRAVQAGSVVSAGWLGGYGNAVVVDHGNGLSSLYAHQSSLAVRGGERVEQGQTIGAVGATGYVTGPHLHFEIRDNGKPADPQAYR